MKKIKELIKRLGNLWCIADEYHGEIKLLHANMAMLQKKINERTTVHTDIHMKSPSLVIVVGEYRGRDYVRAFEVPPDSLHGLIDHLRHLEPYAKVGRMDMIPHLSIKAVYPNDRF